MEQFLLHLPLVFDWMNLLALLAGGLAFFSRALRVNDGYYKNRPFLEDDRESWQRYTNPVLWAEYEHLRQFVLDSQDNGETASL